LSAAEKYVLTSSGLSAKIGTILEYKGSEEKSKPKDAVQRTPVGVRGYG
jgi:hypothetical protein